MVKKVFAKKSDGGEQKLLLRSERLSPHNIKYITLAQHR